MANSVVDGDTVVRVENESPSEEIFGFWRQVLEDLLEILPILVAERLDVLDCFLVGDEVIVFFVGCANDLENFVATLMKIVTADPHWNGENR
mgnify:CR=1 FL=1